MTGDLWAQVEIMGRRTRAGRLSDVTIGGTVMLAIEHPSASEPGFEGEPLVEFYNAATAVFAIRPCTRDDAVRIAVWAWRTEADRTLSALASLPRGAVDDDEWYDEDRG